MHSSLGTSHSENTINDVINFALNNLPEFAFVHYVGKLDMGLLKALNDMVGDKFWGIVQVSGFYKRIADPSKYPAIRFLSAEGTVGADLLIMDTAWTPGYSIQGITERLPPKLIVLIDDGITDALIDKYDWNVVDNIAVGKLRDPGAKWIGELK